MEVEKTIPEDEKIVGNIKSNMLLIGPTGVGKTYIIKLIAKKLGVPFVKADVTKFSETGYVGGDVEDLVRELVHEADGDITKAEYGIIYLDEIDKIAASGNFYGPDVSRTGVQRNLLKLMEEAERVAERIVKNGPMAIMGVKEAVIKNLDLTIEDALKQEWELSVPVFASKDAKEGPRAFKEKREPKYVGE